MPMYSIPFTGFQFDVSGPAARNSTVVIDGSCDAIVVDEELDTGITQTIVVPSFFHILAIMLYPKQDDEQKRNDLLLSLHVAMHPDVQCEGQVKVSIPASTFSVIRGSGDFKKLLDDAANESFLYGLVSGYICGWCVFRAQFSSTMNSASLGAACRMIEEAFRKTGRIGGSVDNIKKNKWPIFRSVAHLWAAYIIFMENYENGLEDLFHGKLHALEGFVLVSEYIREKGESHRPKGARASDTLLNSEDTWKADRSYFDPYPHVDVGARTIDSLGMWDARITWMR